MYAVVKAKFTQHPELKELLTLTGNKKIIEHTANDTYWGDGGNVKGKNTLGKILMSIRAELKSNNV